MQKVNVKSIFWEPWQNPMVPDFTVEVDEPDEEYVEARTEIKRNQAYRGNFVIGPMGVIPLSNVGNPERAFKLFVGHTNFNVSESFFGAVKTIPGVEILKVMSRYRIWLGVARMFNPVTVKAAIDGIVAVHKPSGLAEAANDRFKFWAIGKMPNGKTEVIGANDRQEYLNKLENNPEFITQQSSAAQ